MTTTMRIGETEVPRVGLGTNRLHDTDDHAAFIRDAIDAGIRHIDTAYLYSGGQSEAAIEDSLGAIVRERDRGPISRIGVSNVDAAQLKRALAVTEIAAVQSHYNLAHREHDDVLDLYAAEGIVFVPYFPLREATPAALPAVRVPRRRPPPLEAPAPHASGLAPALPAQLIALAPAPAR